jgi:hypothetical protein
MHTFLILGGEETCNSTQIEYLFMKREKARKTEEYRKRKLEVMEEMLSLQQQSTAALLKISESLATPSSPPSLMLSPVIKF